MSTRAKLVVAALALCGVGVFVVAGVVSSGNSDDTSVTSTEGLIAISPQRGAEALQQERVSVTLEVPWVLTSMRLFDNRSFAGGVALDVASSPEDTVADVLIVGASQWVYEPGDGKPWPRHSADDNCVAVTFENIQTRQSTDFDWCFTAS